VTDHDSYSEILLAGMAFKLRSPLGESNLATFQRKLVIGDYTQDSNPLLSAWVISDLSGGLGVEDMNEASDATRYRIATLYPRYPNMIANGFDVGLIWDFTGGSLGKLRFTGNRVNPWAARLSFGARRPTTTSLSRSGRMGMPPSVRVRRSSCTPPTARTPPRRRSWSSAPS
jgi:hypothetical protein